MCRGNNHNGRRCPSDTSEARLLRRRNVVARSSYAPLVAERVEPKYLPPVVQTESFTTESVQADIQELTRLGERLSAGGSTSREVLTAYDQQIARIGAGVEYLAETKYGALPDADFRKAYDDSFYQRNTLLASSDEIPALEVEERELYKKLDLLIADQRMSYLEKVEKWKELDPELLETWKSKNAELNALYNAEESAKEETAQISAAQVLEERSEALKSALKDVGVQFATPETLRFSEDSHKNAINSLKEAIVFYPKAWVEASNNAQEKGFALRLKDSRGRAHYQHFAQQRGYTSFTEGRIMTKPDDWRPDPHDLEESAYTDLNGEVTWTDPISGEVIMASSGVVLNFKADGSLEEKAIEGSRHWLKVKYDYKQQEKPPRGAGWERIEIQENAFNKDGVYGPTGALIPYYRKPKTRREVDIQGFKSELTITPDESGISGKSKGFRVALHEFAHRVEMTSPPVAVMEDTFLRRRSGNLPLPDGTKSKPEALSVIYHGSGEEGYKDNFPDHYMGKVYGDTNYREILSTGMEALFAGSFGGLTGNMGWKADSDYKKFILGVLASSAASSR